ncbi:CHASE domain-containing hybrid sensor histidine kinase/response regulator [Musicola paradisiaca]|nr:PAS domain S-box protein [Musicola paradisiaca]
MTFLACLGLTMLVAVAVNHLNEQRIKAAIIDSATPLFNSVIDKMNRYRYGLLEARTAVLASGGEDINPQGYYQYGATLDLANNFPGARGFGFVRRVLRAELADYLDRERHAHLPDFSVSSFGDEQDELYVVEYLEPRSFSSNATVIGLDLASNPFRKHAADEAMLSGQAIITSPLSLKFGLDTISNSFLLFMPIYRDGVTPDDEAERRRKAFGWAYAPISMAEVLKNESFSEGRVILRLSDVTELGDPMVFYRSAEQEGLYPYYHDVPVLGRVWRFSLTVTPAYLDTLNLFSITGVILFGIGLSVVMAMLVNTLKLRRADRKQLQQERSKLEMIVESSPDGIIGKDTQGIVISWNGGAERLFGYTREEAIGRPLVDLIIPEQFKDEEPDILRRVCAGETVSAFETLRHRKDGSELVVSATISPIRSPDGRVIGVSKTVRDISLQKEAERRIRNLNSELEQQVRQRTTELAEVNLLFRTVLSAAHEFCIIATDLNGVITFFNKGAVQMLGYSEDDVVGKATPAIFHDEDELASRRHELSDEYGEAIHGFDVFTYKAQRNQSEHREWTYWRKDGSRFPVNLVVTAMRDEQDQLLGYLGVATDITRQRQAQDALEKAKRQADEANEAKTMFLANMSHEIRTPMNAVLGMLQLLLRNNLTPRQHAFASKAHIAATSLLGLLNDILDYSKIDAGKLELDPQPFDFNAVMQHLAIMFSGNLRAKSIELLFDLDPQLSPYMIGDELRLQQVLINLLSNAIKFTDHGDVIVKTVLLAGDATTQQMRISVTDSGIGISPEQQTRIFGEFIQAEASTTRRYGGTGLGLVICKRLVEKMAGVLEVDSALGQGSTFSLTLTFPRDTTVEWVPPKLTTVPPRILVVDDNHTAGALLVSMLAALQIPAVDVVNAAQALAALKQASEQGNPFEIVLIDEEMPDRDGFSLVRQIRHDAALPSPPTLILLGSASDEGMPESGASPDIDRVLAKPVMPIPLLQAIAPQGETPPAPDAGAAAVDSAGEMLKGLSVLLVEDNAFNQEVARELLIGEGASVTIASGGEAGVRCVTQGEHRFDVVLMDLQMPDIDGFEATRRIRAHPDGRTLPIIAMTANVSQADKQACQAAGMNGHLGKPLDFTDVIRTLAPLVGRAFTGETSSSQEHGPLARALQRFGGNRVLLEKLLHSFMPSFRTLSETLKQQCAAQHWQDGMATLHTLKGITGTVGLDTFFQRLASTEAALKCAADTEKAALFHPLLTTLDTDAQREYETLNALIAGTPPEDDISPAGPPPDIDIPTALTALDTLLSSGNLKAISQAERLSDALRHEVALATLLRQLAQATENLEFDDASRILALIKEHPDVEKYA